MLASIDVGSNTVRLLLGTVVHGKVVPHSYIRRITRLKGGQTENGLAPESMQRTIDVLKELSNTLSQYSPTIIRAVGTEALRSASNSQQFIDRILQETGLKLEIIDGDEEALLSAAGAMSAVDSLTDFSLIFDIGGGSTEFVLLYKGEIKFQKSCKLGVVDLTEACSGADQRCSQIRSTTDDLLTELCKVRSQVDRTGGALTLIGTAGTVTTLAALDMQMHEYDWRLVNGYRLDISTVEAIYNRLIDLSISERERLPGMEKGRGDLMPAGIEIILEIMRQFHCTDLTVSDFGLLEGILLKMPQFSRSNR